MQSPPAHPQLAGVGAQLAVDEAKERGLAGPARPGYLEELALADDDVDRLEHGLAAVRLGDADELDRRCGRKRTVRPRLFPGRRLRSRSRRRAVAVLLRANTASRRWSASHPFDAQISPSRDTGPT